jgi:hypothetical protein
MTVNVTKEVAALGRMALKELRSRYAEAFGEGTNAANRAWLIKRIAWRLQALAEGDLSERARRRAAELANDADLRMNPPKVKAMAEVVGPVVNGTLAEKADDRLPPPGTVITRPYKGAVLQVKVLADGFEYQGEAYRSLSAVARAVTGQHVNGFAFFRICKEVAR